MNTSIINFDYKGSQISFISGDNVMINATQMAKPFGKSAKDFLKTEQTKRFINALSEVKKILSSDLVRVVYGYTMSEALKVAWMNMKLKMQMKQKIVRSLKVS